jgi:hypothetical protein
MDVLADCISPGVQLRRIELHANNAYCPDNEKDTTDDGEGNGLRHERTSHDEQSGT